MHEDSRLAFASSRNHEAVGVEFVFRTHTSTWALTRIRKGSVERRIWRADETKITELPFASTMEA